MQTRYKHMYFEKYVIMKDRPHPTWLCCNNTTDAQLGKVEWYASLRQYRFAASSKMVAFDTSCLKDIIHFIDQLKD